MRNQVLAVLFIMGIAGPACAASGHAVSYKITQTVPLGAPDRWDYLQYDAASDRVYVAHGDEVTVVDGTSGKLIGNITGMPGGTHGIVVSHATKQGFTDDGKAGEVAVFDPVTLQVTKRIKAEPDADGIVLDETSGHIFVIDGDSAKITVIDPKTDNVIATIDGGGGLEAGLSGNNGKLYVDGAEKNEMVRVDTATNAVDAHWPMQGCVTPRGIAFDAAHHRLFASCGSKVMIVLDADSGKQLASLPIDQGSDGAGFDPGLGLAFSSNFAGNISVIAEKSPSQFEALAPIPTQLGARTMTLNPKTHRLYVVTADIAIDPSAAPTDYRHRFKIAPGTARLLFLDPAK
ncbi:MAG TPA: YncE family protein [Rhizomicrobium sp.]|jgi:YVTN family beta-propeller protein